MSRSRRCASAVCAGARAACPPALCRRSWSRSPARAPSQPYPNAHQTRCPAVPTGLLVPAGTAPEPPCPGHTTVFLWSIIDGLWPASGARLRVRDVGRQVQAGQREGHGRVQLDAPAARVLEALDQHDQQLRQAPQVQLLGRLHVCAAAAAEPAVALAQLLRLQERLCARGGDGTGLGSGIEFSQGQRPPRSCRLVRPCRADRPAAMHAGAIIRQDTASSSEVAERGKSGASRFAALPACKRLLCLPR